MTIHAASLELRFNHIHHIGILDLLKEPGKIETTYVPEGDLHMNKKESPSTNAGNWVNQHSQVNTNPVGSSVTLDSTPLIAKAQASRQPLETRRQDTASSFGVALRPILNCMPLVIYI